MSDLALPSAATARLPAAYESAKAALASCVKVDECKTWADKAQAIASYARQADDETLLPHAQRIKARAIRRCGELLKEFEPDKGRPKKWTAAGPLSRKEAADDAGLSRRQRKDAIRVANVPDDEFEAAVEADKPATVTELADRGTKKRQRPLVDLKGRDPAEFTRSTKGQGVVEFLADYASEVGVKEIPVIVRGAYDHELPKLMQNVCTCHAWLSTLKKELTNV